MISARNFAIDSRLTKRAVAGLVAALVIVAGQSAPAAGNPSASSTCLLEGCQEWAAQYNGPGNDVDAVTATAVSPDGSRVFVTGLSFSSSTSFDFATVAFNAATGAQLWVSRYNGPANSFDNARDVTVSPDGSTVYVTGVSTGSGTSRDYATVAYDAATGAQQWAARYNHVNLVEFPHAIKVAADGSKIFVTGESSGGAATAFDFATVAYNADGSQAWVARYNGPAFGADKAYALAVTPDGSAVAATGQSFDPDNGWDLSTVGYNAATGAQLWSHNYNGTGDNYDVGTAIAASPDSSRFYVGASSDGPGSGWDAMTFAHDATTGSIPWSERYNGPSNGTDAVNDITVSPDGSKVVLIGTTAGSNGFTDILTVARNTASGSVAWTRAINGTGNSGDTAAAVTISSDSSRVYVAGDMNTGPPRGFDVAAVALDAADGATEWSAFYNGTSSREDFATSLALSPDGTWVYLGGSTWRGNAEDYVAVAFRAVGAEVPSEPRNVTAAPGAGVGEIAVAWEAPAEDGGAPVSAYRIYRAGPGEAPAMVAEVDASNLSYTDGGRLPGLPYYYSVTAVNVIGEGAASSTACSPAFPWSGALPAVQCGLL